MPVERHDGHAHGGIIEHRAEARLGFLKFGQGAFAVLDILGNHNQILDCAGAIPHGRNALPHPMRSAIAMQVTFFHLEAVAFPGQDFMEFWHAQRPVLGMGNALTAQFQQFGLRVSR